MNSNVASFDSFDTDQQIAAHQAGLVRVILEGGSDVQLFSRFWFTNRQETFQFIDPKTLGLGNGCTAVADAVTYSRQEGVPAFGIIDRDTLFRNKNWGLLFNIDGSIANTNWQAARIYVTSLWEVEAYLLDPDLLYRWVEAGYQPRPGPSEECEKALSRTIEACETLLEATPYFAVQHEGGNSVPPAFCYNESSQQLILVCEGKIAALDANAQASAAQIKAMIQIIIENKPADQADRLRFLLRYVDTKRLINRLTHSLKLDKDAHWILATLMKSEGRQPTEFNQILDHFEGIEFAHG